MQQPLKPHGQVGCTQIVLPVIVNILMVPEKRFRNYGDAVAPTSCESVAAPGVLESAMLDRTASQGQQMVLVHTDIRAMLARASACSWGLNCKSIDLTGVKMSAVQLRFAPLVPRYSRRDHLNVLESVAYS